jgi:hypothetical protein
MGLLEFVEFLISKNRQPRPRHSLKGLWADLAVDITEEDIAGARREMWCSARLPKGEDNLRRETHAKRECFDNRPRLADLVAAGRIQIGAPYFAATRRINGHHQRAPHRER